jgi:hypothetical protein
VAVWFPVETRPLTALAIAAAVLGLCFWGWDRSSRSTVARLAGGGAVVAALALSSFWGWDPARAIGEIGLLVAITALVWLASRSVPPRVFPTALAFGLACLAIWGIWQAVAGLDALQGGVDGFSATARDYAEERLASRRAFASLPLPSHLAVVLATALPLLLSRIRATLVGAIWAVGGVVAVAGLAATRSPVGVGLALAAVMVVAFDRRPRQTRASTLIDRYGVLLKSGIALVLVVALVAVVMVRPDVARLEPVALRLDNWRTGGWLWSTSPCAGVGLASYAQASQNLPLEVGNRPAHAHSLPVEGLAEFGVVGLVGSLLLGLGLVRVIRRLWSTDRALAVSLTVVPLHNLVDFSFFVSGVALPWAVLLGWAAARGRAGCKEVGPQPGRVMLVLAASVALAVTAFHATSVVVEQAAASQTDPHHRFDGALQSTRLAPWRAEPQFLLAAAALEAGDRQMLDRASTVLDRASWVRPDSAALAERRSRIALERGDVAVAVSELWSAVNRGAPDPVRKETYDALLTALERPVDETSN